MNQLSKKTKIFIGIILAGAIMILAAKIFFYGLGQDAQPRKISVKTPFSENLEIQEAHFPDITCDISDYGAKNDGKTLNTDAFKKAIESCSSQGGGTILVGPGRWLTGPINLKDNINLHLKKNAEILFSTDFKDYLPAVFSRYEGIEYYNYSPPVYTKDARNVAITGEGTLNGQAEKSWWDSKTFPADKKNVMLYRLGQRLSPIEERVFGEIEDGFRPTFVEFVNCEQILIDGVTLVNGPMWTIHPLYSQNIIIRNIKVETEGGDSTDGVAIDSSRNVLVENCDFSTGDDAVAIKSGRDADGLRVNRPSENIVVRNCRARTAHAAIAIGSEVSGGIRNIFVDNFSAEKVKYGLRIKAGIERGGFVENLEIRNLNIENAEDTAIEIDQIYAEGTKLSKNLDIRPSRMENIRIINITAEKSEKSIVINGHEKLPVNNIVFQDIRLDSKKRISVSNASALTFKNFRFKSKEVDPTIEITASQNILFSDSDIPRDQVRCENCRFE